jgi:LuxR family transcriptional regulator, maltose regulon positive regulatory protein
MPAPLLTAKLHIPTPRPQMVPRPSLVIRLNQGLAAGRKLTLISASAGFGKTTLLSEWIGNFGLVNEDFRLTVGSALPLFNQKSEISNLKSCWLSLDEADSDPVRFLLYLVSALQTVAPDTGQSVLAALQTPQPPPAEDLLTGLLNEIAKLPQKVILVLDDYHLLDSSAVDSALTFLLDHLPPQLHLVIASREDPNLPLPRLRARNQLTELRVADLRFSPAEAAEFLNRVMGLNLTEADVAALESRTEGWIAGLQLAALSMQGQTDPASFIQSFTGSHRFVLDYLLEEVLTQQPPKIQDFLLRTAILNRLCGPLCEAVLDASPGSGQIVLESLEQANLFLVPLDDERRWYRYHHLFGDLLRQRLGSHPELPTFHLRASQWYEENGDLAEAFHHAHAAGDFERAAHLSELAWPGMEEMFQSTAWLGWVKKLPETVILSRPLLCCQLGRAFSDAGQPEISEIHLKNAERALVEAPNLAGFAPLQGDIALTRAYNAQVHGDITGTIQYAEQAVRLIPAEDVLRRAQAVIMLEFTHWASGDLEASLRAIQIWMDDMRKLGNPVFEVASAFAKADLLVVLGRLDDAIQSYRQALQLAAESSPETQQITAHHHLGLALIYHERGQGESVAAHWQTAAELGQRTTLVDWPHRWKLAQARFKESAGEWGTALNLLDEAQRVYVKNPVPIARPIEAMQARIYIKQGRRDSAEAWVRERGISLKDEATYLTEYELLTLARLRFENPEVHNLLERLLTLAESQNRLGSVIEILLTQSLAYRAQSRQPEALAALKRALTLAAPQGYLRTFVDEGEQMRLLIGDFRLKITNSTHPLFAYANKLLATFLPAAEAIAQSKIENQNSEIFEPLTERELEVLRLVAQGLSNAEISQRLYLALSTVKGHNQRIFDKLQAQNRTEAVVRARELGLL